MDAPAAPGARNMRMEAVAEEAAAVELAAAREEDVLQVILILLGNAYHNRPARLRIGVVICSWPPSHHLQPLEAIVARMTDWCLTIAFGAV
jgi:hypothetical protein